MPDEKTLGDQIAERDFQRIGACSSFADHIARRHAAMGADVVENLNCEFRQGDVSLERWDRLRSTSDRLRQALDFLYY